MLTKKQKEIIESLDWGVYESENYYELEKYSPRGEDYSFSIEKTNIKNDEIKQIRDYAESFDANDHCKMWVEAQGHVRGVPEDIGDLYEDAQDIQSMLYQLADTLQERFL